MPPFLRVIFISLAVLSFYTVYSRFVIPQVKPSPPPEEGGVVFEKMTVKEFTALGKSVFHGKGSCSLCHRPDYSGRAPASGGIALRAEERVKETDYRDHGILGTGGKATTAEGYLRESMVEPSAYVVKGYGVKGTDDMKSPMPVVTRPPVGLSDYEVDAVIAYLQASDGVEITVKIPEGMRKGSRH